MPGTFINITITDPAATDPELAQKLADICPVDIFTTTPNGPHINQDHLDECVLCQLCINATPPGTITIHKLYQEVPA
jgi:NAD-dependent dihydropyrimidine dehydrogenase PreA subunit